MKFYVFNKWDFYDDNIIRLWEGLSPKDRAIYPFDVEDIDWDYFNQFHVLGLRVYMVKDDIHTLPQGRKNLQR